MIILSDTITGVNCIANLIFIVSNQLQNCMIKIMTAVVTDNCNLENALNHKEEKCLISVQNEKMVFSNKTGDEEMMVSSW